MVSEGFFQLCILDVEQGGVDCSIKVGMLSSVPCSLNGFLLSGCVSAVSPVAECEGWDFCEGLNRKRPVLASFCSRILCEGFLHVRYQCSSCNITHTLSECIQGGYGQTNGSGFVLGRQFVGSGKGLPIV